MKRKVRPYTEGDCLSDVVAAMKRYRARTGADFRGLCAVLDAATKIMGVKPRDLRPAAEREA